MSNNPAIRLDFEQAMSDRLKSLGVHAVPGYNILLRPKSAKMDPDYLKAQIKEHQIDAVLVTRLVSETNESTYIPGQAYTVPYPYYNSFYGYYGHVYPTVYTPGLPDQRQDGACGNHSLRNLNARGRIHLDRPERNLQPQSKEDR